MIHPDKIFGRLGNRLFQMAFVIAWAKDNGTDIYLQDPKYFDKHGEYIKQVFGDGIGYINKVAVHVRRGDYVGNSFYVDLSKTDYYQEAMAKFPGAEFLVFSDDIAWCKQQDVFKGCEFSEGWSELADLNRMASCAGHIIANSSFSWWGAYLAPNTKKVIAPKAWHPDGVERTKCPDTWIRI